MGHVNEQMTIVIVGHVDHGKSTVIGRLLADTGSLPDGKLEQVKRTCVRNAKPFEYAFLLDALKDEQAQGITIDSARVFFKSSRRHYIIFDAPGHIEFLKNMVTGAAHAQAALLVIDAHEGIRENSRRHGYLLSMLGVRQVSVLVNKMDLVGYDQKVFEDIVRSYTSFLVGINVKPVSFIPVSAFHGENIASRGENLSWHRGLHVLEQLDEFLTAPSPAHLPFRFPVQDVYKFTESGDDRRIVAGTVQTGTVHEGDEVVFLPSQKKAKIASIEEFNRPAARAAFPGQAAGFTLDTQIYIKAGELMARTGEEMPSVATRFKANVFWLGKTPLLKNKRYGLKVATARVPARVADIVRVVDASDLFSSLESQEVATNEVAEVVIETEKPIAFDVIGELESTARFVIVDHYEICGGGIITEALGAGTSALSEHVLCRDFAWVRSGLSPAERSFFTGHPSAFVLIVGPPDTGKIASACAVEAALAREGKRAYYFGISNLLAGLDEDVAGQYEDRDEHLRRLGELARIMTDAGLIFIATVSSVDRYDISRLRTLASPARSIVIGFGEERAEEGSFNAVFPGNPPIIRVLEKVKELLGQDDDLTAI